jgi:ABC-type nitrate/sulfonate/bicarbonate transport system substrate-binding protein
MAAVRIRLLWYPQAQFAGYHIAERMHLARRDGVDIVCQSIRFDQPAIEALLSGEVELAVASPSHLLESARPADLRFILTIQQESALAYPVTTASGIAEIKDLRGRRIAVWPGHEDLELRWMLRRCGLEDEAVKRIPVSETVEPFLAGEVDCAQMTVYHELQRVRHELGADNLRVFTASTFGASLIKDGVLASKRWLDRNREQAQAALDAILHGWTLAFTDEALAIDVCAVVRPDMPRAEHVEQLRSIKAISLTQATLTRGLGYPDPRHLRRCLEAMRALGLPVANIAADELADAGLWQRVPPEWRRREWLPG